MPGPGAFLYGDDERRELMEVIQDGYFSRYGQTENPKFKQKVLAFEREFARFVQTDHCLAVNSGTSALMASLVALGVGPGDEVIVPGYTFIASLSSVLAVGGRPILAEVDESLTIDPNDIERKMSDRTKAVIPVHMLGNPCDMDRILPIAEEHRIAVLEDACQALGGSYRGRRLGTLGRMGAFSLNIFKTINTGDGGIVVTRDRDLYERAFAFHDQGHLPLRGDAAEVGKRQIIGINLRMNELSGAAALAQLRKLDHIIEELKDKKRKLKSLIADAKIPGMAFRKINDEGECNTLLCMRFDERETAQAAAAALSTKTLDRSGWHVYSNMEHLLSYRGPDGKPLFKSGDLPQTDDILSRCINLSVGVVDAGIGASFGINILSTDEEIETTANTFIEKVRPIAEGHTGKRRG